MKAVLLAALFVLGASVAQAVPQVTVTASEVIQADPLQVRTTFDLDLVGPGSWRFIYVFERGWWFPATGDTTRIFGGSAPSGWSVIVGAHEVLFNPGNQNQVICFGQGAHFTFSIVTNNVSPCVYIRLDDPTGFRPYSIDACLVADGPTLARATTWGALKSSYR